MSGDLLPAGWLTTEEAQALTGYTAFHLARLARGGQVNAQKIGRQWVFAHDSLTAYKATVRPGPKRKRNYATATAKAGPKGKQAK